MSPHRLALSRLAGSGKKSHFLQRRKQSNHALFVFCSLQFALYIQTT
jgi:hypothetical protein